MDHQAYIRVSKQRHTAVLMIHGIIGSPRHFDVLIPLIPEDWSIYNILLNGHGKTVRDFSHASMDAWRQQITDTTDELCRTYDRVVIIGHSMGTLFAMEQAIRHPNKIAALLLLASPLHVHIMPTFVRTSLKATFGKPESDDVMILATRRSTSISPDKRAWRYVGWAPRFWELLGRIRATRALVPRVAVPTFVWQSRKDELVSLRAVRHFEKNPLISVSFLENSGHYYYPEADLKQLTREVADIIQSI